MGELRYTEHLFLFPCGVPAMALTLHQSNRIEYLSEVLATLVRAMPLQDVFAPEEVLVTAAGMRRFVDLSLAQKMGVAANIRYDNVAAFFWRIMFYCLPDVPQENVYAPPVLRWRLLAMITRDAPPEVRAVLDTYLQAYDTADYALAQELARLFDQYLVYRPQWMDAWSADELVGLGTDEAWQALLWRQLRAQIDSPHRVALWQELRAFLLQDELPPMVRLPQRVFVFGVSTLAPVYLGLFEALARHCDVHLLALNPSAEHWGNVLSAAQRLRTPDEAEVTGNPLLASLGKQGRDFFDMLSELQPVGGQMLFAEEASAPSLLAQLQADIQAVRMPRTGSVADDSIVLVSAYSPLRELQAVKDAVVDFLAAHPHYSPDDVAILSPAIEDYAPFIEAVFGRSAPDGVALPYSIADTKISRGEPFLQAWEMLLALFASRFEVNTVLPLLDNECVLRRFDLSRDDVSLLQRIVRETNVHWAWDAAERERAAASESVFTWSQALERVLAGVLLPEDEALWQGIAPFVSDMAVLPVLSRFADLLETLAAARDTWQVAATVDEWAVRIHDIGVRLLDAAGSSAAATFAAQVEAWQTECVHADFGQTLSAATVNEHLRRWLAAPAEAGFLRGGVTFGSMIPLRNLPFAYLALIGMNDGSFPRASRHAPFDLMNAHPQKGDRSRRDDDRYLFLESLMSAREVLYLSYVGRSIHDNEPFPPSELISELGDTLAVMTGTQGDYWAQHARQQPLQPFSPRHFLVPQTYRADYAAALNAPREAVAPFFSVDDAADTGTAPLQLSLSELIDFWRNPPRAWLQRTLSWRAVYRDAVWEDNEPFTVMDQAAVNLAYLDARRQHQDFDAVDAALMAQSRYPAAHFGVLERVYYRRGVAAMDAALFAAQPLPAQQFSLSLDNIHLSGRLDELTEAGQIFFRGTIANGPQRIADYLTHLFACAVCNPPPITTIACPGATETLPALTQDAARTQLKAWCAGYALGQTRPLPFFAKTSLAAARVLQDKNDTEAAMQAARSAWFGNDKTRGQCDYAEVKAVFSRDEILPLDDPLFWALVRDLLVPLAKISNAQEEGNDEAV